MKKILITENELTFLNILFINIFFIITEENQTIKFFKKLKKNINN